MGKGLSSDGELITLEVSEENAEAGPHYCRGSRIKVLIAWFYGLQVARQNIANASLSSKIKVVVGPAVETMPKLGPAGSFDLVFIDADKENNLEYFIEAKRLVRIGGVIIVDNVVRNGRVADPGDDDSRVLGVRRLLNHLKTESAVDATTIATVGEKGYDGFIYSVKLKD